MRLITSHMICTRKGSKYANPSTAILIHFTSVVCMTPVASTDLNQSKSANPKKLSTSMPLTIHQKIHEIFIKSTPPFECVTSYDANLCF